ncbi:MAG: glycoside hydrolase [Saprospiraceae bacterium]|nr:glycoside hydrolase [Saprospiraceae bacterium]
MRTTVVVLTLAITLVACQRKISPRQALQLPQTFKNIKIDGGPINPQGGPCEPSIAINPSDIDNIVAGAILNRAYSSMDGGKTWATQKLSSSFGVFGDPVITTDFKGNFFYSHLSDPTGKGWQDSQILDRIVIQKSKDGGKTWDDGSYTGLRHPKDQDKQWLAVHPETSTLYISWTEFDQYGSKRDKDKSRILFSQSSDEGKTWASPIQINELEGDCIDDDQTPEGAVPAVGLDGTVYIAWSYDEKIYLDKSTDGGASWLDKDIVVSDQPGGWTFDIPGIFRANGLPITAIDNSQGPHSGTLYVNWCDQRNGEADTDVWLAKSTDQGKTWSAPIRVNDDSPGKQQFFTWMDIDQTTGNLYFVFYDRRAYEDNQTDVYIAYSTDGGKSFINQKVSETPFTPSPNAFFGDYNNISAHAGRIRPIWTRADGMNLSVWTALIDMESKQ